MLPGHWPRPKHSSNHAETGSVLKWCSPISSASLSLVAFGFVVRAASQDEFTLAAIAQNLRRVTKLVVRPPPAALACAP